MDRFIYLFQKHPLSFIAEALSLLPIFIGIALWKLTNKEVKYLIFFFIITFIKDFTSDIFAFYKKDNLFIYNIFSFVEILLLISIFYNVDGIESKAYKRKVLWYGIVSLVLTLFLLKNSEFSSEAFTVTRIYGIFVVLSFYYHLISKMYIRNITYYSTLWVSAGLLVYYCGTFFIFLMGDLVLSTKSDPTIFQQYWDTNLIFYILLCLIASIGIWVSKYDQENIA